MSTFADPVRGSAQSYVVRAQVSHTRTRPFSYRFSHKTTSWLVDAAHPEAHLPRWLRPLAGIHASDHLGTRGHDLPTKIRILLDEQGLGWSAASVKMLVNARTFGYVFNPLTTYFCFSATGELEGILAEVHNTYGERHVYPLAALSPVAVGHHPSGDEAPQGSQAVSKVRSSVAKEFYVSPFFAVEGRYDIKARLTDEQVAVSITLTQGDERVFSGSTVGQLRRADRSRVIRAILRDPLASQRVTALIRFHGIRLWLRKLPVIPRRPHRAPRGMA